MHNVRLIAVNEGLDSDVGEDDFTPFRNVMNEWYIKDISRKPRSSQRVKSAQGYAIGQPPLGYMRDPDNPKRWVIDEEGAAVVRMIFAMRLQGVSVNDIAQKLRRRRVLTPSAYALQKGTCKRKVSVRGEYFSPTTTPKTTAFPAATSAPTTACAPPPTTSAWTTSRRWWPTTCGGRCIFLMLAAKYDDEQAALRLRIRHLQKIVQEEKGREMNADGFLALVRRYTDGFTELSPEMVQEFIDKIVVHQLWPHPRCGRRCRVILVWQ
jgi:hypothetical protein